MNHINIDAIRLKSGSHSLRSKNTVCLLEAVAWFAEEKHSDRPECVSPVLAAFGRAWNDGMRSDEEREQLKQYIPLLVNTVSTPEAEDQRAWLALDWLARVCTPAWLRLARLEDHAKALERLEPLVSGEMAALAQPKLDAAGAAAGDAAGAAAWDAAWIARAAARAAAGAAAWAAAWDAAWIARAAARAAAWDAAWAAARAAAGAAARAAAWDAARAATRAAARAVLEPTVKDLQASAHDLYQRMIAVGTEAVVS